MKKRKKKRDKSAEATVKLEEDESFMRARDMTTLDAIVEKIVFPIDPFSTYTERAYPELHIALLYSIAPLFSIGKFVRFTLGSEKTVLASVVDRDGIFVTLHYEDHTSVTCRDVTRIDSTWILPVYDRPFTPKFLHFTLTKEKKEKKAVSSHVEDSAKSLAVPTDTNDVEVTTLYVPRRRTKTASRISELPQKISLIDTFKEKEKCDAAIYQDESVEIIAGKSCELEREREENVRKESQQQNTEEKRPKQDKKQCDPTSVLHLPSKGVIRSVSLNNERGFFCSV